MIRPFFKMPVVLLRPFSSTVLSKMEGIIPAIESAHAVAHAMKIAPKMDKDEIIMVCLSGRGDKDVASIAKYRGVELNE